MMTRDRQLQAFEHHLEVLSPACYLPDAKIIACRTGGAGWML